MAKLKDLVEKKPRLAPGHRLCPGCGASIIANQVLGAIDYPVVVTCATGCLEVSTTPFPFTSWEIPFIHSAFENSAATISGVEAAYNSLKRQGKVSKDIKFVAFGGDGGTYDIGFQALSGAVERGHDFLYICYDNGAYMNTGIQRSSATPIGAATTTAPPGKKSYGKIQRRKDLTAIMAAHQIPYAAQASPSHWKDLVRKVEKAVEIEGPTFINVLSVCPRGWRSIDGEGISLSKEAVMSCYWPLYEVENGDEWKVNMKPKGERKTPVADWLKKQGRFKHLFKSGNEGVLEEIQAEIDDQWQRLLAREEATKQAEAKAESETEGTKA